MNAGIDPGGELGGYGYGGEMDVFEALGAPVYEPYDPYSGWASSQIPWEYSRHFPPEAFELDPYYQPPVQEPLDYLWEVGAEALESKTITDALWGWTLQEIGLGPGERAVQEGPGVTVLHTQPPQAGGAPAQPYPQILPGVPAPPQAVKLSATILIGAGLVVLYFLLK
ncbi:hypothetical protein ES702_07047 [subsurface metagenome]